MSSQDTQAILLDTSFLLPTVGIDVENQQVYKALEKLAKSTISIYYSEINLIECSW